MANELGLNLQKLNQDELANIFTGQTIPDGSANIALAYAGHQFGHFVPQLGDGRALLLGEVTNTKNQHFDIQLKGSGRTPFSRGGDGKSSLGPVIREYIVSEAMHHLGVRTTRALAAAKTGDLVHRETPLPGGVFTRVASSHIRVGTFQYHAARGDFAAVKELADYTINRYYPALLKKDDGKTKEENIYLRFIESVANAQASMVASWMSFGFIHGVMNTDNMSISGETLDYGPCAFMDNFSSSRVFSSIDRNGRYAYGNQLSIAKWNLFRLAECLIPLIDDNSDKATEMVGDSINSYLDIYEEKTLEKMRKKFGLYSSEPSDQKLVDLWLQYLEDEDFDFTLSFRELNKSFDEPSSYFKQTSSFKNFYKQWKKRVNDQPQELQKTRKLMNSSNPIFIPRNHQVERAIQAALQDDFSVFQEMNKVLKNPFTEQPEFVEYKKAPVEAERIAATFCGT